MGTSNVALKFVSRINAHDVEGMVSLMSRDHVFIDSLGNRFVRPEIEEGWRQYFTTVPDYGIAIESKLRNGKLVVIFGTASGTYVSEGGTLKAENRWATPAAWRAVISRGKVSEWRIYADNEPIRAKMREEKPKEAG